MRRVNSSIYTKKYYLFDCLGFEEFAKTCGETLNSEVMNILQKIPVKKGMRVLDIGCGRGDIPLYFAKKGADVTGIDYAKDAITIANNMRKKKRKTIQSRLHFFVQDAKKLLFQDNSFDVIISLDVFEHLYKEELEIAMREIKRVLKKDGTLLVHTEANKIYLDFWHRIYVYPISQALLFVNRLLTKHTYPGLPKDPRNSLHKQQHVNEPTIFYLRDLFHRHGFNAKIFQNISHLKKVLSWKDLVYNIIVLWYPISFLQPFCYIFCYDFTCICKNKK